MNESYVGVRFRKFNNVSVLKGYKEQDLKMGASVIVETDRGMEFGNITMINTPRGHREGALIKLRKLVRYADEKDIEKEKTFLSRERDAFCAACSKVKEYGLQIKVINAEILFDESKAIVYFKNLSQKGNFSSKEFVRDVSSRVGLKVEMQSVSARDEARIIGGIGICGRGLCCSTFLDEFPHVTVKMLKEQGIPMNQSKVCGVCGKLLCCLQYEYQPKVKPQDKKDQGPAPQPVREQKNG